MNKLTFLLVLVTLLLSASTFAQKCNCAENFNWMVKTFEENDAGFQYVIDKKGKDYYEDFKKRLTAKVSDTLGADDCVQKMREFNQFFRGGHLYVQWNQSYWESVEKNPNKIVKLKYTEKDILKKIQKKSKPHFLEGVWYFSDWGIKFGVLQSEESSTKFLFYKMENIPDFEGVNVVFEVEYNNLSNSYLISDLHNSVKELELTIDTLSNTISYKKKNQIERFFVKVPNTTNVNSKKMFHYNYFASKTPYFEKLTPTTLYLRVPSFRYENKFIIDSILKQNEVLIKSAPNLIIDIRNGTGGSDESYQGLIPFIQTNTTYSTGQQFYATELNAKGYDFCASMYQDSLSKKYHKVIANKMRANLGKMIDIFEYELYNKDTVSKIEIIKLDFPKQIAIICNKNNASADEAFLMEARQSKKVKVFGSTTAGMLDISNLNCINSPDGKLNFCYGTTKSYGIPNFCIDDAGVQPDIYYQGIYSEVEWVDKVVEYLEN
jgi:hypothetical protein